MKNSEYISANEVAKQLGWTYHRLIRWIKKDKAGLVSKGLATKMGWNWLLKPEAIPLIKEMEGQLELDLGRKKNKRKA